MTRRNDENAPDGLLCPKCGCPESRVVYTRRRNIRRKGDIVRRIVRRRECKHCGTRSTTWEIQRIDVK